jgi:hypothetical protein
MYSSPWWMVKFALGSTSTLLGLIAATLGFWASAQTKAEQSAAQDWFRIRWRRVAASSWGRLPEFVTMSLFDSLHTLGVRLSNFYASRSADKRFLSWKQLLAGLGSLFVTIPLFVTLLVHRSDNHFMSEIFRSMFGTSRTGLRGAVHILLFYTFVLAGFYLILRQTGTLPRDRSVLASTFSGFIVVGLPALTLYCLWGYL